MVTPMPLGEWEKNEDGTVSVYPLVAFETLVPHGVMCGLKIHYFESPASLIDGQSSSLPLILTPELARGLALALSRAADDAERGSAGELPH